MGFRVTPPPPRRAIFFPPLVDLVTAVSMRLWTQGLGVSLCLSVTTCPHDCGVHTQSWFTTSDASRAHPVCACTSAAVPALYIPR